MPDPADFSAETPSTPDAAASSSETTDALVAARTEAAANLDRYLRAMADLENFRRRAARDKEDLRLFAASGLLEDLLPVLDNLALGLTATKAPNADLKGLAGGVEMVLQQLRSVLVKHSVKELNPAGQTFDPHQHEAIAHVPDATVPAEHVVTVVRTGYQLNGRLLRPASVIISSGPAKEGKK